MPHSLQHHGLQHARTLSPTISEFVQIHIHWVSDVSQNISSSASPFSFCLQSFPASGSFSMSWYFTSNGQNIGASVAATALPMNIQGWFPLGLTGLISLLFKGLLRVFSSTSITTGKHQFFDTNFLYGPTLTSIHDNWKNHSIDHMDICWQSEVSVFLICWLGLP